MAPVSSVENELTEVLTSRLSMEELKHFVNQQNDPNLKVNGKGKAAYVSALIKHYASTPIVEFLSMWRVQELELMMHYWSASNNGQTKLEKAALISEFLVEGYINFGEENVHFYIKVYKLTLFNHPFFFFFCFF